ncbi:MAG: DsbA family protein [Anaerolineae bacterium]
MKSSTIFFIILGLGLTAVACTAPPEQRAEVDTINIQPELVSSSEEGTYPATSTPVTIEPSVAEPADAILVAEPESESSAGDVDSGTEVESSASLSADGDTYNNLPVGFTDSGHPYIGNLDAPVVIEEYSDYQCPFCSRFAANAMAEMKATSIAEGKAVVIFYDYPLDFHPQAEAAANAARCAGETSAASYWAMHDVLFENVGAWSISDPSPIFIGYGETLGLNADFPNCVQENRYQEQIQADLQSGLSQGVTGTPSFFLNGEMLVGAQPIGVFNQAIEVLQAGGSLPQEEPQQPAPSVADVEIPPFSMPPQVTLSENYAAVMGDPDAPILIVEFTDYQCPFCGRHSAETMPQILAQMIDTGRVRYALKDFPLDSIHPDARLGSVAARCAGEQNFYWEMHDQIFINQAAWGQGGLAPEAINQTFMSFAAGLGLNIDEFGTCLADGRYDDLIEANLQEGLSEEVTGTPAFFIDGYFISGAQPFEVFDLVVSNVEDGTIEDLFRSSYEQQIERYKEQLAQQEAQQAQPAPPTGPVEVSTEGDPFVGDPDAPVTIIEFTDFQCPFCARHHENTYPFLISNYVETGFVKYVFKQFPLNFHPEADEASEAALCANDQSAYLDMHNKLFETQQEWSGNPAFLDLFVTYASEIGLDTATFAECLNSGTYTERVQAQLQEGFELGVSGTPTFFINGNIFVGAQPIQNFAQAIDSFKETE